jgi:nucleoside-diphosphate-sugar epimerase
MNILIIGCGYVGSAVAACWQQQGHNLTVTTTTPEKVPTLKSLANQVIILHGNDIQGLTNAIENQDLILLSVGGKRGQFYRENYLETAQNIVKVLESHHRVRQLIYTSSYGLLGNRNGAWIDEEASVAPPNENSQILAETERVLLAANSPNLKVCILRLAGIYGPGREIVKIFRSWAGTIRPGNGEEYGNWVHLEDIVRAIALAAAKQLDGVYHLANDTPIKRKELLDKMCQIHGLAQINWDRSPTGVRPTNLRLSNQKIKDLGFMFLHPETEI